VNRYSPGISDDAGGMVILMLEIDLEGNPIPIKK